MMLRFPLSVCQPRLVPVFTADGAFRPEAVGINLETAKKLVLRGATEHQSKIFLFPEFMLQGYTLGRSVDEWIRASITLPGPETDYLAELAKQTGAYIAGAVYERHQFFPDRYWNTAFIIDPQGQLALVYRKLYALTSKTRPGDIYTEYIAKFGIESLFPVLNTPLGKIGILVAGDIHWPETARALALRGAEIILNPTGAAQPAGSIPTAGKDFVRQVRAWENSVYIAMANIGPFLQTSKGDQTGRVPSDVSDFTGRIIARADTEDETIVTAQIDIAALRAYRAQPRQIFWLNFNPRST